MRWGRRREAREGRRKGRQRKGSGLRGKGEREREKGGERRLHLRSCDVAVPKAIIRKEKGIEPNLKRRGGGKEIYTMAPRSADEMVLGTTEGGEREEEAGVQRKPSGGEVLAMCSWNRRVFGAYRRDGAGWCSMPCDCPIIATNIPAPQPTAMPNDPGRTGEILGVRQRADRDPRGFCRRAYAAAAGTLAFHALHTDSRAGCWMCGAGGLPHPVVDDVAVDLCFDAQGNLGQALRELHLWHLHLASTPLLSLWVHLSVSSRYAGLAWRRRRVLQPLFALSPLP